MQNTGYLDVLAVIAVDSCDGIFDIFIKRRNSAVQNVSDKEQYVLKFVSHCHLLGWMLVSLPTSRRQQADVLHGSIGFLWRHGRVQQVDQMFDDVLFFAQHRASCRLCRVRRENRFYHQRIEQFLQAIGVNSRCPEFDESVLQAAWLIMDNVAQVLTPAPDAMYLFSRIHHLKIGRKTAYDLVGFPGIQAAHQVSEFLAGLFVVFASPDRAESGFLHELV